MLQRAGRKRAGVSRTEVFPAPAAGWVQSGNIAFAGRDQAEVLDNFFPTAQGARVRGGSELYADMGAQAVEMMSWESGATVDRFGSTATAIYDLDRLNGGGSNSFADVEGLSSGDWSSVNFATTGGNYLICANGTDTVHIYDGTEWNPLTDEAVNNLGFDAETAAFAVGETLTGGTSSATAEILGITKTSATAGTLKLGAITGTFQDNETITSAGGSATSDGTASVASSLTLTGVATSLLSNVFISQSRLFFIEKNSRSFWYLAVDSIGGALTEFQLGSVFKRGGNLLFGSSWSLNAGDGLSNATVFVTDRGEVAVYEGTDPSSASDWRLVGVYELGVPVNKHGSFRAGGNVIIITEDGAIPLTAATQQDRAALQTSALSLAIEDAWQDAVSRGGQSKVAHWQSESLLFISTPTKREGLNVSFVANSRTGAWARILGWDMRAMLVADDEFFFANVDGKVYKGDVGGSDNETTYRAAYVAKAATFSDLHSCNAVGLTYRCNVEGTFNLSCFSDYEVESFTYTDPLSAESANAWGTGVWGTFVWGGADNGTFNEWQAAYGQGYALAPVVTVQVNQTSKPEFEILATRMRVERGYAL